MRYKLILTIPLIAMMLFAGFNFLPQFKINNIPIFHLSILLPILISFSFFKKVKLIETKGVTHYKFYLIASIPALIIGLFYDSENAVLIYLYSLFPFLLFWGTATKINYEDYLKLLWALNISMILIVLMGWLIRLSIIPVDTFFQVSYIEFSLEYWGISYGDSTRNHDYLYPLIGLAISLFFFTSGNKKLLSLILISIFILTLIASLSRGAIIISTFSIFLLWKLSTLRSRIIVLLASLIIVLFTYNEVKEAYDTTYRRVVSSIFEINNEDRGFSNEQRLIIAKDAIISSAINPIGYGIANYSSIYKKSYTGHISASGENAYLTILVERGWLAFFFFFYSIWVILKDVYRHSSIHLNKYLIPFLMIYWLFNYELNNVFASFLFYNILLDAFIMSKNGNYKINKLPITP